jgi:hypothetical protein
LPPLWCPTATLHGVTTQKTWTCMSLGYGLDDQRSIPGRGGEGIFSLRHRVQTGSEAHPDSCLVCTDASFLWCKADH